MKGTLALGIAGLALVLAGCGGDGNSLPVTPVNPNPNLPNAKIASFTGTSFVMGNAQRYDDLSEMNVTGLSVGETLIGADVRPATGQLYALSNLGQLYVISDSGVATKLGDPIFGTGGLDNTVFDFNPLVDRIRVTNGDENYRINPETGEKSGTDTKLARLLAAGAYTNSVAGATTTVLYAIDAVNDKLVTVGSVDGTVSPNTGQVFEVGNLGIDATATSSFDIRPNGMAYLVTDVEGRSRVYTVNLTTGAATLLDTLDASNVSAFALYNDSYPTVVMKR